MKPISCLVLRLVALVWALGVARAAELIPNADCLDCHRQPDLTKADAAGRIVSLFVDEAKLAASAHRATLCASCHRDLTPRHPDDNLAAQPVDCAKCHQRQSAGRGGSVHGLIAQGGEPGAATCTDCHGSHEVLAATLPASRLHFANVAATCGECHPRAAQDVAASVHGQAAAPGDRPVATCTDCHSEHQVKSLQGAAGRLTSVGICGQCHGSARLNTVFRLPPDRVETFFDSYHGLAVRYGSARAANCASCHGAHRVLPSTDPDSSVHPDHLVETCGKCHPGATANFAQGQIHGDRFRGDGLGATVNRWVRRFYVGLIVVIVGLMGAHNLAVWLHKALAARRSAARTVPRMDRTQRIQHLMLLLSFALLALTGFALMYPDSWLAWMLGSNETIRRWLHRGGAVALLLLGTYHLFYVMATIEGRRLLRDLRPSLQDFKDAARHARHLLGKTAVKPRYGRFGYVEKIEYWAVVWGTLIMGITGLTIWLKVSVTQFLPRWVIEVATTIHYYEAILACLAVVVWHCYHVVFDPDVYPLNWAWWDGRVLERWYRAQHALDPALRRVDNLGAAEATAPLDRPPPPPS